MSGDVRLEDLIGSIVEGFNANLLVNPMTTPGDMIVTIGGNDLAPSGTASASSVNQGGQEADKAFDGTEGTAWFAYNQGAGAWLKVDFGPSPLPIASYQMFPVNAAPYIIGTYKLQSSTNNVDWTDRDTTYASSNVPGTGTGVIVLSGGPVTARYWRILVLTQAGYAQAGIATLNLYAATTAARIPTIAFARALLSSHPKVPTKAGVPTDSDTLTTAADGMMILDTTNHRLYVRDGGVWKYAALT